MGTTAAESMGRDLLMRYGFAFESIERRGRWETYATQVEKAWLYPDGYLEVIGKTIDGAEVEAAYEPEDVTAMLGPDVHRHDGACVLDEHDCCRVCGVWHGDPCAVCGGRGFHRIWCSEQEQVPTYSIAGARG
jgi:hypothetical protein